MKPPTKEKKEIRGNKQRNNGNIEEIALRSSS